MRNGLKISLTQLKSMECILNPDFEGQIAVGLGDQETIPSGINRGTIPHVYTNLMGFTWV